jgi:outer membrane receptor protein involved in Fe transport
MKKRTAVQRLVLRPRPIQLAIAVAFGGAQAWPVLAQEAETPSPVQLDEVTITATRRASGVQEVPLNIAAVTGDEIERQGITELSDLAHVVPGLYVVDQGGRDANLVVVRGLNVSALAASEGVTNDFGGVVAQYLGDIPLYIDLRPLDVDRVEVLLGPQGTLYGAGTLGGAIRYIPVRPQFGQRTLELTGGANVMSHSDDVGSEAQLVGNLSLGGRTALRAAVGYFDEPGFIDYDYLVREPGVSNPEPDFNDPAAVAANLRSEKDANTQETITGHVGVRHSFADVVDANLTYHYQDQKAGARTVNHAQSFDTGDYVSGHRFLEPNDRENQLVALEVDAKLGFATLTSATGFSRYDEVGQRDQTDLLLDFEYGYEDFPSFSAFTRETAKEDRFNQEIRLVSTTEGPLNWIAGLFYNRFEQDATSSEFVPGIPEFFGIDRPDNLEYFQATFDTFEEKAVFGEVGYDLTTRWTMTVGGRWFEFDDDQRVGFALPLIDGSAPDEVNPVFDSVQVSDNDSVFKFNTSYEFNPDLLGYFTLSEGYRTGGSNAVPACADPLPPGQNVCALPNERIITPDKTLNHEIGLHSRWLGGRLTVNGAIYYIKWEDIQVAGTTVNGAIPITVNAAEAATQGIELGTRALLGEHWRLTANYSYTKAELTADAPGIIGGGDAFDGDRLPGSPEHHGNFALSYLRPLPNGWLLDTTYGVYAQGDVYTKAGLRENGEALGGFALHNAAVTVSSRGWKARLYANNLLDKYAETGVRSDPSFIRTIEGDADGDGTADHSFRLRRYYKSVIEPMQIGVSFTYAFTL